MSNYIYEMRLSIAHQYRCVSTMTNSKYLSICLVAIIAASSCNQPKEEFKWPNGAKAAIALTYDDGLSSHINTVAPMLKQYKFKATFYPTVSSPSLTYEKDKWKKLAVDGHELGNHTVYHPCQKSKEGMEWVKDEYDLDKYTAKDIAEEINLANTLLSEIDGNTTRTFAYPCSHTSAGGDSYIGIVSSLHPSARVSTGDQNNLKPISEIDLYNVPSWAPDNHGADDIISYIKNIIALGTFSTITFHGIGAEHMTVSIEAHEEVLQFLDANRDEIWVGTFEEITEYLKANRIK